MSGGQFLQRVISWVADKLITERLARSSSFQNFAANTHRNVEGAKASLSKARQEMSKEIRSARAEVSKEIGKAKKEISKELDEALQNKSK